jgi:Domain of unknown function (DUF4328)
VMAPPAQPFVSATRAARWTQGLLVACMVLAAVAVVSGFFELSLLSRMGGGAISEAEANANDVRQAAIGILQFVISLATAAGFLTWFYRAHKNLPSLGARNLEYSPGWAIGGFFVPFLNLVRPFQVMREVWRFSYPSAVESGATPEGPSHHPSRPTLAPVGWWWGLFLLSAAFGRIATRIALAGNPSLELLKVGSVASLTSDLLDIPTAWLAIRIIGHIRGWQNEMSSHLPASPGAAATERL